MRPSFTRETEYGVRADITSLTSIEYTQARRRTVDYLLTGWRNAGSLLATSHEISFISTLYSTASSSWIVRVTGDRSRARFGKDVVPTFYTTFGIPNGPRTLHADGESATAFTLFTKSSGPKRISTARLRTESSGHERTM